MAAAIAAIAAFKANEISGALKKLQKNSILNQREIQLLNRALELLKIYEVWCTNNGAGSNVNFHESKESNYDTRDDAWSQIPRDIKYVLIQLSSHSERLEQLLSEWELGFIEKAADTYIIKDEGVKEKIKSLREIVAGGL
ncbi:hypothetical protein [Vibrio sp. 10N.261.54.A5]|uniref:hypothetical protein n=1 Tax=Vibrio sp. 10N.261.54.A5 TaxID=3229686 RepID=UPI003552C76B